MAAAMARVRTSPGTWKARGRTEGRSRRGGSVRTHLDAIRKPWIHAMGGMDDPEALAEQFMEEMRKRESKIQAQEEGREDVKDVQTWKKIQEGTEEEKQQVQVVLETVEKLKEKRDMTFNEVKLTLMIEDPRDAERRKEMGIEVESGVSREDICEALVQIKDGYIPTDPLALRVLTLEMENWPFLNDAENTENGAEDDGDDGRDEMMAEKGLAGYSQAAEEKDIPDWVPDWVGYSFLYGLSGVPVLIVVGVVIVLFVNSLR